MFARRVYVKFGMLMSHYKMNGYILFVVLIFLQIFSCLGLYELTAISLTLRKNNHHLIRESYLLQAQKILKNLEEDVIAGHPTCLVTISSASIPARMPLRWWQQKSCSRSNRAVRYYYRVESLGNDACAVISKNQYNHIMPAAYYRITLLMAMDKIRGAKLILQSTLAKPGTDPLSCPGKMHRVTLGRQMMRQLS
jgi:hypothetical protein